MLCRQCGALLADRSRFCPSCGAAIDPAATTVAPDDATRLAVGAASSVLRRTPDGAAAKSPSSSGWLTQSDSISHGRFAPGAIFDGRYRIIGLLGRGGMGEVYRADDLRLGQQVALKFLPDGLRRDPGRLAQFHNEVRTARQVSHPNVCRVHDIGEAEGLLYLSMEYVDGEDLSTSLRRIGRFPEDKATDIARQLCAGLAAAHQRGIVHRDLKPANVMLDGAGHVRIMDFGLAALGSVDDVRAGTPAYMAPEQLLGREVTTRSDVFALGLVIYELFTGRRVFSAKTVDELVEAHRTLSAPPPSALVAGIDPAIERAILRCLEPDPKRRPDTALAVAAALPGGDPLAAALAAGETPSPEMVAAAGEGAGLERRVAWPVFALALAGIAASFALAARVNPLDRIRPEMGAEVLAMKAREAVRQAGYGGRARDEAFGFTWNSELIEHVLGQDKPAPQWDTVFGQRPSALGFWYRQSDEPLTAFMFHTDLLTPGIVTRDDPPPIVSGMKHVELDHQGRLTYFEAIPPQRQDAATPPAPVDWAPMFALAGLDQSRLQATPPLWNWLASSDTRAAWTGTWPESGRPLRVEAAALGGRPVAFMLAGPWQAPARMPEPAERGENITAMVLIGLTVLMLVGAGLLARRNLRERRGDRRGAARLAAAMSLVLMALWLCQVHLAASLGLLVMFLLAVCTSVFYGVLLWTIYLAFEPSVRRHWPQVLVSWTNVLTGNIRDPIVGRDVLIGIVLGVAWVVIIRGMDALAGDSGVRQFPGATGLLEGLRPTLAVALEEAPYALRNVLLYFFLLFVLRVLLRSAWAAGLAFAGIFVILTVIGDADRPLASSLLTLAYFGSGAFVVLRWGLVAYVVGIFVSAILMNVSATLDTSAWYFGNMLLLVGLVTGLACWAFYTAVGGRMVKRPAVSYQRSAHD